MPQTPSDADLQALGHRPACLSALTISEIAIGARAPDAAQQAHLLSCPICNGELAAEKHALHLARDERFPARLLRPQRRWPRRQIYAGLAGAMTLAMLVIVTRQRAPDDSAVHLKGSVPILVTVVQNGEQQQTDVPLEQLTPLPPNTQLVLRLGAPGVHYVMIESLEDGQWEALFRGATLPEGDIPNSVRLTQGPTSLRITVCDDKALTNRCEAHVIHL